MKQQNLQPWASASDVMKAVTEITAIAEENRGIPKAKIEHYAILAVISDLEFKHQFLMMLEERCPVAHPQFIRYLHKLAENGRKYSREYRSDMHHMTNHMGRLYGMYGNGIFSRMKRGRRGAGDSPADDLAIHCA